MFPEYFKYLFTFLLATLLVVSIIIINYFHATVLALYPELSPEILLTVSIGVVAIIFYFIWRDESEKEQSRNEFVAIITHKFRTPLTGVKWAIEMLRNSINEQQKQDILAHMENSNERLLEIVDLTAGFAKLEKHIEYVYEAVSLREIVDATLQKYGDQMRAKNVNSKIDAPADLPMVYVDKQKIQFVVDMLIDNAIKYAPTGGLVTISFLKDKKYLTLSVHDTGIGISWGDRGSVFRKYYRSRNAKLTHAEGMGLGLYTAKNIIKKHQGKIWFDSRGYGKGTTFYVKLRVKAKSTQ